MFHVDFVDTCLALVRVGDLSIRCDVIHIVTLCAYNDSMRCMPPSELRYVMGRNRFESGIIILYSASERGYLVLALYKHGLLYYILATCD